MKWKHFPRYWPFCAGKCPVTGEFPAQRLEARSFNVAEMMISGLNSRNQKVRITHTKKRVIYIYWWYTQHVQDIGVLFTLFVCVGYQHTIVSGNIETLLPLQWCHNGAMESQITSLMTVCSTVHPAQIKENIIRRVTAGNSPVTRGIHRWPVNSPNKWPVKWKMYPSHGVITARV